MLTWWQHLPEHLNPIAFTVGFFSVHWYALFWLVGFFSALGYALLVREKDSLSLSVTDVHDLFLGLFFGALVGGRLGYALFYRPDFFFADPSQIVWPYDSASGLFVGVSGMSFHGGLLGAVLALFFFVKKRKSDFLRTTDFIALSTPIALFFGRLGNFFNGELYGRVTLFPWGMYFPGTFPVAVLRHPSTLYEAFFEGIVLFFCMMALYRRFMTPGYLSASFLFVYGAIRFLLEYVREPDFGVSLFLGIFTRGQALSLCMIFVGSALYGWIWRKNRDTMMG